MELPPFLLDQWLSRHAELALPFPLGGSAGPHWTLGGLLQLGGDDARRRLFESEVVYGLAAGACGLREAIAEMREVPAEQLLVVGGGSEALLHVFFLAAEPGANVIVPFPGFPRITPCRQRSASRSVRITSVESTPIASISAKS